VVVAIAHFVDLLVFIFLIIPLTFAIATATQPKASFFNLHPFNNLLLQLSLLKITLTFICQFGCRLPAFYFSFLNI